MTNARLMGGVLLLMLAPSVLAGCGKDGEERPPQTGQYVPQNQQGYGGQAASDPSMAGSGGAAGSAIGGQAGAGALGPVTGDPAMLQNLIAGALAGGVAALGNMTGGELAPIEQGIKGQATTHAVGMKPDGQLLSAKLGQDTHAEGTLTLQPGGCYTVLGFGGFGVFEYQINLLTAPPAPPQILAQSTTGAAPVLGEGEQCIRNPGPGPMVVKVDMHLIRGQGLVGAQAYRK